VYGTANARSDEDFVAVLAHPSARRDLVLCKAHDVIVHTRESFAEAVDRHSVLALECLFAPPQHRLKETRPRPPFTLDRRKLAESAMGRSRSDFEKAARRFADEPVPSKKKLFHALRVPMFALQLAREGRIVNFGEASSLWQQIEASFDDDWERYRLAYGPLHEQLIAELTVLTKRSSTPCP
jgi:hypothetical protein